MKSDQTVRCDVLTRLYMLYEWVFCSQLPSVVWESESPQPKLVLNSEKARIVIRAECQGFQLLVVNCYGPNLLTRTNATSFPVTLNERNASRFEDRLDSRARRFLRMLVIVDNWELVYIVC